MAVLAWDEFNHDILEELFKRIGTSYHEISLGFPSIGEEWNFENSGKIMSQDWRMISRKVFWDYESGNGRCDLVLVQAHISDRTDRFAQCFSTSYNRV
ncbi:MAG: hypothetical protein KJ879_01320 [Nanoarchaeota archaeon]|nr:hypothetical protein [Nanoarchaeota archaeon]